MAKNGKLTAKEAKFIQEYLIDLNASGAALRAGYSSKTAHVIGWENLRKPKIQEALAIARQELSAKTGITPERTIKERGALAYADIRQLFNPEGCPIPPHEIPDEIAPAIAGVEIEERIIGQTEDNPGIIIRTYKYKTWDKNRALEALDKHFGLYNADQSQKPKGIRFEIIYEEKKVIEDGDN